MSGLSENVLKTIFPCLPNVLGAAEMKRIHDSLYPKVSDSLFTNTVLACTAATVTVENVLSFFLLLRKNPLCRLQRCGLHDAHPSIPIPSRNHFRGPFCISTLLAVHGRDGGGGWRQTVGSVTGGRRQIVGCLTGERRRMAGRLPSEGDFSLLPSHFGGVQ